MIEYDFQINSNNQLSCWKKEEDTDLELDEVTARKELQRLDASILKHIQVTNRKITIDTNYGKVNLIGYQKLINNNLLSLCPNIFQQIHFELAKIKRQKRVNRNIKNLAIAGTGIVGALAFCLLKEVTSAKELPQISSIQPIKIEEEAAEIETLESEITYIEEQSEEERNVAYLDFSLERYSITGEYAYNLGHELVEKYAAKWGISFDIPMAIYTQESAGKGDNVMQIEFDAWKYKNENSILTVYNFEENRYENFVLTDSPEDFVGRNITCITSEDLKNPITNISIGCVLLRQSLHYMNYHIGAGIQCYNFGYGNMMDVLEYTANIAGIHIKEILNDQTNLDFMNYTYISEEGDPQYLQNVMRYVEDPENGVYINRMTPSGEVEQISVSFTNQKNK